MSPPQEQDPALTGLDPLRGRVIAKNFRIDALIGAGAMGNVYRAEQLSLGKFVAVKVLHHHLMSDQQLVGRFKREAKSASLLNHANSIQIIDSGQDESGLLYIAMELIAGRDLAEVIRDDFPLPLPRVIRIMSQVLSALDEAHAQGVIHRDLKPSNIMLVERRGEKDFVKVCDFGIAKANDSGEDDRAQMLTVRGLVCGTPEYMSPEQARAEPIDGRSDLYSAAVILYQLLTGDLPFRGDSPMAIVSRHLTEPPVPPSVRRPNLEIPSMLDDIVLRGMEKARELRFPTAVAFREALEILATAMRGPITLAQRRLDATTEKTVERRSRKTVVGGAIALLAASLAGAVLFAFYGSLPSGMTPPARAVATQAVAATAAVVPPAAVPTSDSTEPPGSLQAAGAPPVPTSLARPVPVSISHAPVRERVRRRPGVTRAQMPTAVATAEAPTAAIPVHAAAAAPSTEAVAASSAPGARDVLTEAEKLLAQGEVGDACARAEEAKRLGPKLAAVYKFLGKCYMRASRAREANDNYRKYLELAPGAADAPFVKSMIK